MESIVQPSKEIAPEYEAVAIATKDGKVITGLRVNETNFSVQLYEENGRFHSLLKRDLGLQSLEEVTDARERRGVVDGQRAA